MSNRSKKENVNRIKQNDWERPSRLLIPVLVLTFALYINSLHGPFQFDDYHHVYNNAHLYSLANIPKFFTDPSTFSSEIGVKMYRPLLLCTLALNIALFGPGPLSFHLTSVLIHCLNVFLVFALLRRYFKNSGIALLGGLFFGVAAVNTQAVNYISSRSELLSTTFMLAALLADPEAQDKNKNWFRIVAAGILFFMGLLCKEIAFILPLIVICLDVCQRDWNRETLKKRIPALCFYFALDGAYLILRLILFHSVLDKPQRSVFYNLVTQTRGLFWYIGRVLMPVHLAVFPEFRVSTTIADPAALAALAGIAIAAVILYFIRRRQPWIVLGLLWLVIGLLPTSTLMPLNVVTSEQRTYFPSVGLIISLAALWRGLMPGKNRVRNAAIIALALIIFFQAALTVYRNRVWKNEIALWADAVNKVPVSTVTWCWLGISLAKAGALLPAETVLHNSLNYNPQNELSLFYLGMVFKEKKQNAEAEEIFKQMITVSSADFMRADALGLLGLVQYEMKKIDEASDQFKKCMSLEPDNFYCLYGMGIIAHHQKQPALAESYYNKAIAKLPDSPEVMGRLGRLYMEQGNPEKAVQYLEPIAGRNLPWPEVNLALGNAYFALHDLDNAKIQFQKCMAYAPDNAECFSNMGAVFGQQGKMDQAQKYLEHAVVLSPQEAKFREPLTVALIRRLKDEDLSADQANTMQTEIQALIKWFEQHGYKQQAAGLSDFFNKTMAERGPGRENSQPGEQK